jgi:hypothetical protein
MTQATAQDVQTTVDAYFAIWNVEDPEERLRVIAKAWAEDGRYVDPARDAKGHAALNAMVEEARPHFPGCTIERTSAIDQHHDQLRFTWKVVAPDGSVPIAGTDFGILAADGRLAQISGFFGEVSPE